MTARHRVSESRCSHAKTAATIASVAINAPAGQKAGDFPRGRASASGAEAALAIAKAENPDEIAVIGGGEIFDMFLPLADRVYLTEVDLAVEGDTFFPELPPARWHETARESHAKGPNDTASFILRTLDRRRP